MVFRLALAQIDARVGDITGNTSRVHATWHRAAALGADVVVFPELALTGYPPGDLLRKRAFIDANLQALDILAADSPRGTVALVGHVGRATPDDPGETTTSAPPRLANAVTVLADGRLVTRYDKMQLPDYGVFDESRYFVAGTSPCVVQIGGVTVGVTVCEDVWVDNGPVRAAARAGAQVIAILNASPYNRGKFDQRHRWLAHHARTDGVHLAYANLVGGQDEVVFDGDSMIVAPNGQVLARAPQFVDDLLVTDLTLSPATRGADVPELPGRVTLDRPPLKAPPVHPRDPVGEVWAALVRATRDYCHGNGFTEAIIGFSGGIDSALVAAVAAEALGPENVLGVAMPSPYSSQHSLDDAQALATNLGCHYLTVPISQPLQAMETALGDLVVTGFDRPDGRQPGTAYENLQSRLRGAVVMTLSNERGGIVLTTGNKSEMAVGYATLYGDMAGGFAPLKDIPKLLVYELAHWCNRNGEVIPNSTITKPPSAELRPGQLDADSLPDYAVLDDVVMAYVEEDLDIDAIVDRGHDRAHVTRIVALIDRAEHKRRQAAPGPKITGRAFGRDRRLPITNLWGR